VILKIAEFLLVSDLIDEAPNEELFFFLFLEGNQFVQLHFPGVWMGFSWCKNTGSTETIGVKK
jgi:hypothetical protein